MRLTSSSILLASVGAALGQGGRPADTSICDYYTSALLKDVTAENQLKLLTLVVNTAVIGNCEFGSGTHSCKDLVPF